jgi:hypothetical protein
MVMTEPTDYQANFESDVWNAFHALGLGYGLYLTHFPEQIVRCVPPKDSKYGSFDISEEVVQELINKGLVLKTEGEFVQDSKVRYDLTDKGRGLNAELSNLMFVEGGRVFVSKVQPVLK